MDIEDYPIQPPCSRAILGSTVRLKILRLGRLDGITEEFELGLGL